MERNLVWSRLDEPGFEHLRIIEDQHQVVANGVVIVVENNTPFRVRYVVHCDTSWRVRAVDIEILDSHIHGVYLRADGKGHWTNASDEPFPSLNGCIDADISATPFTNTIAIRRLNLAVGEAAEITVAYIKVPEMQVRPIKQRYTCLAQDSDSGQYRYEGLLSNFTAELDVDRDGLVVHYPELFRRVWTNEESATEQRGQNL